MLLIGHSNAGKSPVGAAIAEAWSTPSRRWFHFDFGHHLRRIWRNEEDAGLSIADRSYLDTVMQGTLIDDDHFAVAQAILLRFLSAHSFKPASDRLVLNGLPRHAGQAAGIAAMGIEVLDVVHLSCSVETAFDRKQAAEAGKGFEDRLQRDDNSFETFCRKAASFEKATLPLLDYYVNSGARLIEIPIAVDTGPADVVRLLGEKVDR
jgi:adenylate kinase family enzyme